MTFLTRPPLGSPVMALALLACGAFVPATAALGADGNAPAATGHVDATSLPDDEGGHDDEPIPAKSARRWLTELKRQSTDRGSAAESTKTTLRIETLSSEPIAQLRLDIPLPDAKTSFAGSPFDPRLGDIKLRVGARPVPMGGVPVSAFFELSLPTADPSSLGNGKYQVTLGARSAVEIDPVAQWLQSRRFVASALVQQVFSVGGDESRASVNYTKFELGLRDVWRKDFNIKLTFKPVVDWTQGERTGADLELEGMLQASRHWSVALMLGGRLWGTDVPGTYDKRVELTLRYRF